MRRIRILSAAVDEAAQATAWYENERSGLGAEFEAAVDAALDILTLDPIPSVPVQGKAAKLGARRVILKRFPFDVVFIADATLISVIAFSHHSRQPGYWHRRLRT